MATATAMATATMNMIMTMHNNYIIIKNNIR
jgi:hypothetical protein